jgi:transcriptional regulator with XRE-family HTH domain
MSFGARLAEARKRKGLTQTQLGQGLGTDGADASKAVVYGWEKDQHFPRVDQFALICEKLKVSPDFLLLGVASEGSLSPELAQLAAAIETLTPKWKDWVLMTLREAIKLAREADAESSVTAKNPSSSKGRKAA